jgi:hypothetical protein
MCRPQGQRQLAYVGDALKLDQSVVLARDRSLGKGTAPEVAKTPARFIGL